MAQQNKLVSVQPNNLTDAQLLQYFAGMYDGGKDVYELRCHTKTVVKTRKQHQCLGNFSGALHDVPAGSRMIKEHALVEGEWRTCYTCEACVLAWAIESHQLSTESALSADVETQL